MVDYGKAFYSPLQTRSSSELKPSHYNALFLKKKKKKSNLLTSATLQQIYELTHIRFAHLQHNKTKDLSSKVGIHKPIIKVYTKSVYWLLIWELLLFIGPSNITSVNKKALGKSFFWKLFLKPASPSETIHLKQLFRLKSKNGEQIMG